ncbi:MAG TPA: YdeI/OmpD-associated family protein [Gammaproteobacteria bacterium]|nr:YdeI/OmpD-associated family protein [Gammaproteobacteria bacterium]
MKSFVAKLEPVPHGGHYVVVPIEIALDANLRHASRVRGTVNGAPYRSSLMMYGGVFHLGVHKATLAAAGVQAPAHVTVTIELDAEPLPTDAVPDDLAKALKRAGASAAWRSLRPSLKREHVQSLLDAKKPETRERRVAKIVAALREK